MKGPAPRGRSRERAAITAAEASFVEETAVLYESFGLPRMAGRILGWLLICDPAHQSLAQLGSVLKASKGSISTMSRTLVEIGIVKRISLPGDRRDYVVIPDGWLSKQMASGQQRSIRVRQLAEDGLRVLAGTPPERQARLNEMRDLYSFMERETPALLERWQRERDSKRT